MNPAQLNRARQLTCGPSPAPIWKPSRARSIRAGSSSPNRRCHRFAAPRAITPRESPPQWMEPTPRLPRMDDAPIGRRRFACRARLLCPLFIAQTHRASARYTLHSLLSRAAPASFHPSLVPFSSRAREAAATAVSRPRAPPRRDLPPPSTSADPQRPGVSSR